MPVRFLAKAKPFGDYPIADTEDIQHGDKRLDVVISDIETVNESKADKTYVDEELAKKADEATVSNMVNGRIPCDIYEKLNIVKTTLINFDGIASSTYIVEIPFSCKPKLGLANGTADTIQTSVEFSHDVRASIVINAGVFNMTTNKIDGRCIKDGIVIVDRVTELTAGQTIETLCIDNDGYLSSQPNTVTASQLKANGTVNAVQGWYPCIVNGQKVRQYANDDIHGRTVIGQKSNGNYIILVTSKTSSNGGLGLNEISDELISRGCVFAYNLDGGGSSSLVYRGIKQNSNGDIISGDRAVSTFLYWEDNANNNDLYEAFYEIGKLKNKEDSNDNSIKNINNQTLRIFNPESNYGGIDIFDNFPVGRPPKTGERTAKIGTTGGTDGNLKSLIGILKDDTGEFDAIKVNRDGISDIRGLFGFFYRNTTIINDWDEMKKSNGLFRTYGTNITNKPAYHDGSNSATNVILNFAEDDFMVSIVIHEHLNYVYVDRYTYWNKSHSYKRISLT